MEWSNQVISVMDEIARGFGVVIDWTQQNVMPYVMDLMGRIILYRVVLTSIAMGVSLLFIIGVVIYMVVGNKKRRFFEWNNEYYTGYFVNGNARAIVAITLMAVAAFAGVPVFLVNLVVFVRCLIIPEMIVVDFISKLL